MCEGIISREYQYFLCTVTSLWSYDLMASQDIITLFKGIYHIVTVYPTKTLRGPLYVHAIPERMELKHSERLVKGDGQAHSVCIILLLKQIS